MKPGTPYGVRRGSSVEALSFGRKAWRGLVEAFGAAAAEVVAGRALDVDCERTLRGALRRAGGSLGEHADTHRRARLADLPVEGATAGFARDAFAAAAAGFLVATAERRALFAPLLAAACALVGALMDADGQAAADRTWKRHMGET